MIKLWSASTALRHFLPALLLPLVLAGCNSSDTNQEAPPPPAHPAVASARQATKPAAQADPRAAADRAWQAANRIHTEAAYRDFMKKFPADTRVSAAMTRAGNLAWNHAQRAWDRGDADPITAFPGRYPNDPHAAEARKMAEVQDISLAEGLRRGWVSSNVSGDGLQSVSLTINRTVRRPLRVSIPAGTFFVSQGGGAQNMVACEDGTADLTSSASSDLSIRAACANFYRDQPDEKNTFSIQGSHPNPRLRKVLAVIAEQNADAIAGQLAIWSITDNPSRDEVEEHITPSPEADDYQAAARLLKAAGVSPSSRRMFRHGD